MTLLGRATQESRDTRKTSLAKQPALSSPDHSQVKLLQFPRVSVRRRISSELNDHPSY